MTALTGYMEADRAADASDASTMQRVSSLVAIQRALQQKRATDVENTRNEQLRAAIQALPPEKRTRENVLPLLMQFGNVKEMVPLLKGKEEGGFTLNEGQARFDSEGNPIATATAKNVVRQRYDGENVIQEERQSDGTWKEIGRGPRFAKTVPNPSQPAAAVTTAEVIDPTDPTRMLKVDARTYKGGSLGSPGVIGVSGNVGARAKLDMKRQFNMQGIGKVIQDAEDILTGKNGDALPTQSGVGTGVDYLASLVGATPSGAPQADRMRAIGGALTAKMPRMEGPQSDRDVVLYREMAARVGDSTLPVDRRKAALDTVKELWAKYENLNPDAFAGASPAGAPPGGGAAPAAAPQGAPVGFMEGQTATGPDGQKIVFKGGQWVPAGR